jgi:hypothetical protein
MQLATRHAEFVMIEGFINLTLFFPPFSRKRKTDKRKFVCQKKGLVYETLNYDKSSMTRLLNTVPS